MESKYSKEDKIINSAGMYDVIKAVNILHERGYGRLRLLCGLSSMLGSTWVWHLYPKCLMDGQVEMERSTEEYPFNFEHPFAYSIETKSCVDIDLFMSALMNEYGAVIEKAKGTDDEYAAWFKVIVEKAEKGIFPLAFYPHGETTTGWELGADVIPYPPYDGIGECILKCPIAGYAYHEGNTVSEFLVPGRKLSLVREANNQYDEYAVAVYLGPVKIGYLPKHRNIKVAEYIDRNTALSLQCRIISVTEESMSYRQISIGVYRSTILVDAVATCDNDALKYTSSDIDYLEIILMLENLWTLVISACQDKSFLSSYGGTLYSVAHYSADQIKTLALNSISEKMVFMHKAMGMKIDCSEKFCFDILYLTRKQQNLESYDSSDLLDFSWYTPDFVEKTTEDAQKSYTPESGYYEPSQLIRSLKKVNPELQAEYFDLFYSIIKKMEEYYPLTPAYRDEVYAQLNDYRDSGFYCRHDDPLWMPKWIDSSTTVSKEQKKAEEILKSTQQHRQPQYHHSTDSANSDLKNSIQLDDLIGLESVKKDIRTLRNFIHVQLRRRNLGLSCPVISYHCVFTGNPGTGKTTVARIVANIYKELGILKKGHLVETDRSGLVAEYVGQTAVKTNRIIDSALDGVLFIDEAYSLAQGSANDYGREAIATLLKRMEDNRDRLVVILAGYGDEMKSFIDSNPGLQSRFNRYIHFPDYSEDELYVIYKHMLEKSDYILDGSAKDEVVEYINRVVAQNDKNFGNARFVRNMFEKTLENQANRLAKTDDIDDEDLSLIKEQDIPILHINDD